MNLWFDGIGFGINLFQNRAFRKGPDRPLRKHGFPAKSVFFAAFERLCPETGASGQLYQIFGGSHETAYR
jgi:hypothetical protein